MKRNLNKLFIEGKKAVIENGKMNLTLGEFLPYYERIKADDSEEKLNVLYELFYVGIAIGYRMAKKENSK